MVTKVTTSYLFIWEKDLNEILHLIQFKYYFGNDLIFSRNKIRDQVDLMSSPHIHLLENVI